MSIQIDRGDVTVIPLDREKCCSCAHRVATHRVILDVRGVGLTVCMGVYCAACANREAARLRDCLPQEVPE